METFKSFLAEQEQPYKLLILSHDDPQDPNETGPLVRKKASELGIEVYLAELMGSFIENDDSSRSFNCQEARIECISYWREYRSSLKPDSGQSLGDR